MLKRVHDRFLALFVIVLYCDTSFCVNILSEEFTVNEKVKETILKESLLSDENLIEIVESSYDNGEKENTLNHQQKVEDVDNVLEHRQKRQAHNRYQPLYPHVPQNPYQTQPSYNPGAIQSNGQLPHQGNLNNNPSGYPSTQPGFPSAPSNYSIQGSNAGYNPYSGNQNFKTNGPYPQPSPYQPGYGQNTGPNQQFNGNNYPGYPNPYGNRNPVTPFNSTSSLPPNSSHPNYPSQWPGATTPSNNSFPGTRPSYNNVPPTNTNNQRPPLLPQHPGIDPIHSGNWPPSHYPTINNLPVPKNGTGFKLPNQNSSYNPGQYPDRNTFNWNNTQVSQTGTVNRPNNSNSYVPGQYPINSVNPSNTYHPSIPNYPPNNYNSQSPNLYNHGQNSGSYDPRKLQK